MLLALVALVALSNSGCGMLHSYIGPAGAVSPAGNAPKAAVAPPAAPLAAPLAAQGWRCEDGSTLGTRVLKDTGRLELRVDGSRQSLPPVVSASGARYEDAAWLFWSRGAEALFQRKPAPPVNCIEARALSLIEDARVRGVTFRGTGNEPGWVLELGPATRVWLSHENGRRTAEWADIAPTGGPVPGTLRYNAVSGGRRFMITVLPDACVDDMSGDRFTHTVQIDIDGARQRGCGREVAP
jgi:membrane-bound inhibitor of C-type lysozyme/uncharacterized membrane protein